MKDRTIAQASLTMTTEEDTEKDAMMIEDGRMMIGGVKLNILI